MAVFNKKTIVELIVTAALITAYLLLSASFSTPPAPKDTPASVADEPAELPEEPSEPVPGRYKAREANESTPCVLYALPSPSGDLSDRLSAYECASANRIEDMSYFDDALFIGDSVTVGLKRYIEKVRAAEPGFFGNARFFASADYGVYESVRPSSSQKAIHPVVEGKRMEPYEVVSLYGIKKVYICLGLNDLGLYPIETCLACCRTLIESIQTKNDGVSIVLQTVTPVTMDGERKMLYNRKIDEYNVSLAELAAQKGCAFLNVADLFKDSAGYLAYELSTDNDRLLEGEAYEAWAEYLLTHPVS